MTENINNESSQPAEAQASAATPAVVEEKNVEGAEVPVVEGNPSLESVLGELSAALKSSNERYEKLSSEHTALLEATKKLVISGGAVLTSEDKSNPTTSVQAKGPEVSKSFEELVKAHFN